MGAVLIVTKDKKQINKVTLTDDKFVVGRSPECDLPLDEPLASRRHAEFSLVKGAYWLRDCGSRNGTLANGKKISGNHELMDGDEVEIGATRLKFIWDKSASEKAGQPDDDRTRVASPTNADRTVPGKRVVEKKTKGQFQVKLKVTEGPLQGGLFRDWSGPLTIGRGLENHVVLVDDAVSICHAQIVQEGEAYFIVDLNSSNGTFLEGVKVVKSRLSNGQRIKAGISTLVFEMVDLQKQRHNMKIALITMISIVVVALAVKFLQPPDLAGQHIAAARDHALQGDLDQALDEYQIALKYDPNRIEAKRGVTETKGAIEAAGLLKTAEQAAAAEDYEKAKELCYRVLRDYPQNPQAIELAAVVKSIENAKLAFASRNWSDAKHLLEKVHDTYPQSKLIRLRLDEAQNETLAQGNLTQAKDALDHQQIDLAQPLLQSIPPNSTYYTEAKQLLDQIAQTREVADYLTKARAFYSDGDIAESLRELDAGLQMSPENPVLLELQKRVRQMESLEKGLASAEASGPADNVDTLIANREVCQNIIKLEEDPLNSLRKRAQAEQSVLESKLVQVSQDYLAKAINLQNAGSQKEALQTFDLALKANPDNADAKGPRDVLYKQIVSDCQELYQKGIVHESLQQSDQAREAFEQILKIGIPGEHYYELASRKLKISAP
jgi:pSer/pThr/pTyr-binding forkhead associated (FHA) protein